MEFLLHQGVFTVTNRNYRDIINIGKSFEIIEWKPPNVGVQGINVTLPEHLSVFEGLSKRNTYSTINYSAPQTSVEKLLEMFALLPKLVERMTFPVLVIKAPRSRR